MEKQKIDTFMMVNADKFAPYMLQDIRERMEKMDDSKLFMLQGANFQSPQTILIIAILLGWDRFFLDDIGMGVLKILTCGGLYIWWIVDMFTATERTQKYNYNKFLELTAY